MPTANKPRLSDLQSWMRWVLTHPEGVAAALQKSHPLQHCLSVIGETPTVSREKRLSIYGNGYFWRIIDVLGSNFSSIKNIVGAEEFNGIARRYLIKHPSTFKSIDDIGEHMSDFLIASPFTKKFPFLPELAQIEWATHLAFFADDLPGVDASKFKNISEATWQKARFVFDPSARLFKMNWPVDELWRADGNWDRRRLARLKKARRFVLVFRSPDKFLRARSLSEAQYAVLDQLSKKRTFGAALLWLAKQKKFNSQTLPIGDWFNEWISDGIFKRITFK